ncbi:MAG: AAA family ATPase [Clostridiaceae bacterium]|nr:AAA family ATPase [Clostridiaceae bacterium]
MRILDLHIDGFGKFHDLSVSFDKDLNVVYGKNEAGKSTLHTFIRCMLFGLERGRGRAARADLYSKYEPWQNKAVYSGRMRVEKDGVIYRLERNFQKDQKAFVIVNETAGKEIEPTKGFMDFLLGGLTETAYNNTISIGQLKCVTEGGMVTELRNYIANMNTTGNLSLNITKATSYLKNRRKEFERQLTPEAARTYTALLTEIKNIEKEISAPEYENQLQTYQDLRSQVKNQLSEKQTERETLLQKIAKGRQALDGAQFTDEASIHAYQENARNTYAHYKEVADAASRRGRSVLPVIMLVLAVFCALGAGALGFLSSQTFDPVVFGTGALISVSTGVAHYTVGLICALSAAAVFFFAVGLIFFMKNRSLKQELSMTEKLLQEIFSRHLGDSSISGEAMTAFESRMEEFVRLSQVLERSEQSVQEQASEINALQAKETDCDDAISRQQKAQWELEKRLDHLAHCKDQTESLKQVLAENDRIREEITAIDLALETMTELSATIRDSFGLYLNKTASELISGITGGIYDSMSVDESLNVFMNTRTRLVPVEQVSSGTMDQIYLALRLAAAKLIQPEGDYMPLIFDDSFVLYDEDRLHTALKWLKKAYPGQIIIFTCHQREAQMMTADQIAYHLVTM